MKLRKVKAPIRRRPGHGRAAALFAAAALLCALLCGCSEMQNARPITDVHALDGQRVGVGIAWGPDYLLTGRDDLYLMRYNTVAAAVTALRYNRVDAVAVEEPVAQSIMNSIHGLRVLEEPIAEDKMAILIYPEHYDLLEEINAFIDEFVTTEEFADIVARSRAEEGYSFKQVPMEGGGELLQVGLVADGYPFSYPNIETGGFEGTDVEILCHFANACGYSLEFHADTWESMEMGVQYGIYDIGCGGISDLYRPDIERSGSALMSTSFLPVSIVFIEVADRDALAVKEPIDY